MKFRNWLKLFEQHDYSSKEDRIEHEAFNFIFGKINQATRSGLDFIQSMKNIWPENERGVKYFLPKSNFPTLSNLKIRFNAANDESSVERFGDNIETLYIGVKSLIDGLNNKNQNLIDSSLRRIAGSLNHEVTHLHHKGANEGDGSIEDVVRYLVSPGEMRAHAKDYAYTWASVFPNVAFNPQKFIEEIIPRLVESKQKKAKNYLIAFNDPVRQKKYSSIANLKQAYNQFIEMIEGYVNYYISKTQARPTQTRPTQTRPTQTRPTQTRPTQTQKITFPPSATSWQQRQAYLNSQGVDTTGWGRGEIMRGERNKWNT